MAASVWYGTATGTAADAADALRRGLCLRGLPCTVRAIDTCTLVRIGPMCLSACLSVCLSVCLPVCLPVSLLFSMY
jgi:hypothetical protein